MIKRFCDVCQSLMTDANTLTDGTTRSRLAADIQRNGVRLKVEVIHSLDGTANAGDVCKYCVLMALLAADDRPSQGDA